MCHFCLRRKFVEIAYKAQWRFIFYQCMIDDWILVCHKINPGINNFVREKWWIFLPSDEVFPDEIPPQFCMPTNYVFPFKVYYMCVIQTLDPIICAYAYKKTKNFVYKNPRNSDSGSGKIQLKNRRNSYSARNSYSGSAIPPFRRSAFCLYPL